MIPTSRTVVVGDGLRPGYTVDDALRIVAACDGAAVLSAAVLDRPDGTTVVAVSVDAAVAADDAARARLARELQVVFARVDVLESAPAALAIRDRLT